jgi:hypothetical protein
LLSAFPLTENGDSAPSPNPKAIWPAFAVATSAICHGPSRQPEPHIKGLETSLYPFVSAHSTNKQEKCLMNRHALYATALTVAL